MSDPNHGTEGYESPFFKLQPGIYADEEAPEVMIADLAEVLAHAEVMDTSLSRAAIYAALDQLCRANDLELVIVTDELDPDCYESEGRDV